MSTGAHESAAQHACSMSHVGIETQHPAQADVVLQKLKEAFHRQAVVPIIEAAHTQYGGDMKVAEQKRLDRKLTDEADGLVGRAYGDFSIKQKTLEQERRDKLETSRPEETAAINRHFDAKQQEVSDKLRQTLTDAVDSFVQTAGQEVVRTVETQKKEAVKNSIEDGIRDHLRGFSRTIPSFLMAYGSDGVTLESFDTIIPDQVFLDVTSITLADFRFLRDGGAYIDPETGEERFFQGRLFDPVVFNDSVKEFLRLRKELADYFDPNSKEDIFDYIPPQRTNQIFTPRWVVQKMVDMLEQENPGCYDDPENTFVDLYMKSGMYITEIVKRLYNSPAIQWVFPDGAARLRHIFAKQVYGLAPTEIIYKIAIRYILGFADDMAIEKHNLLMMDALPYAREGVLQSKLDEVFGDQE